GLAREPEAVLGRDVRSQPRSSRDHRPRARRERTVLRQRLQRARRNAFARVRPHRGGFDSGAAEFRRSRPARGRKIRRRQVVGRDGRAVIRIVNSWKRLALKQDFDQKPTLKLQKSLLSDGLKRFLPFISLIALCALIPLCEYFLLEKNPVF